MSQYRTGTAKVVADTTVPTAPSAAMGSAGNVNVGLHRWLVTYEYATNKETIAGTPSSQLDVTSSAKQVGLTSVPVGPTGTTARRIYRTVAGDTGNFKYVGSIANNTATTFTDDIADGSLGVDAPSASTFPTDTIELAGGASTTGTNVNIGNEFKFAGEYGFFVVTSLISTTKFRLNGVYSAAGSVNVNRQYIVNRDFTDGLSLIEAHAGDIDTAHIFTRNMRMLAASYTFGNQKAKVSVTLGALTKAITFATAYLDTNYHIYAIPSWNTTFWLDDSSKTTAGCTINFNTAAPSGAYLYYMAMA